jgi:hypothetical protein
MHKNQAGQPSANGGHFATKANDEATAVLAPVTPEQVHAAAVANAASVSDMAGYGDLMPGVYELLLERNEIGSPMYGALDELATDEVQNAVTDYMDDAITSASSWMHQTVAPYHRGGPVDEHITAVSREAGYEGVMPGFLNAIVDREEGTDDIIAFVNGLNVHDINAMYDDFFGPAIDNLEDNILVEHCSECGTSLSDNEGYDGKCGNCADEASCSQCGNELDVTDDGGVCEQCTEDEEDDDESASESDMERLKDANSFGGTEEFTRAQAEVDQRDIERRI